MITLQKTFRYDGPAATAPTAKIAIAFESPAYAFLPPDDKGGAVARRQTGGKLGWQILKSPTDNQYQVTLDDAAAFGADDAARGLARQHYLTALSQGNLADLSIPISVHFIAPSGVDLGGTMFHEALCLPLARGQPAMRMAVLDHADGGDSVLANLAGFHALRKRVAEANLKFSDGMLLALIVAMTRSDGGLPSISDASAADIAAVVEGLEWRATAAEAKRLSQILDAASDALFDFELVVPEMKRLEVAGTVTIVRSDATAAVATDFLNFEIGAECTYENLAETRRLGFRFANDVEVIDNAASFSLTPGRDVLRNGLMDPVRVTVRGLSGAIVWARELPSNAADLAALDIKLPLQVPVTLAVAPPSAELDRSRKLRGQVITFRSDCPLKGALVLIQAKSDATSDWHTVGAATTDHSGNFSVSYPYGRFAAARAIVSLAPGEAAGIPVTNDAGDASISEDFLYLLLKNPQCPPAPDRESCDCAGGDTGNRLPDHADLIASDAYTQDIGGACVNLSKPNRTISEYGFQAIVRISDPIVADYTLTRYETDLETIDVAVLASLRTGATALDQAASAALADATSHLAEMPTVFAGRYLTATTEAMGHVSAIRAATAASSPPITLSVLGAMQMRVDSTAAVLRAYKVLADIDGIDLDSGLVGKVVEAATALRTQVAVAIDNVGTAVRYELSGGAASRRRQPIALDNPVRWQDAPEPLGQAAAASPSPQSPASKIDFMGSGRPRKSITPPAPSVAPGQAAGTFAQAVSVAAGHILHYRVVVKADGYSLGELVYSLPLAPGQKKEIVVFDSSHSLAGAETQAISQNERLAMGLINEREITDQLAGSISESLRGSSSADTRGISAGFGTGGQGYGGTGAYGGSGSAVIGVAGGVAQASSNAVHDGSRDVSQYFGERLRQSIMQNAEGYRRLNASVVTTVQEGQRYGVTSEVVANHNHCHALTMMYFEVLRHFAVYQTLASVEECAFVPLLLARFTTENVAKWRDVLAPALLAMPSDSYLQPHAGAPNTGRRHPLLSAFDAAERLRTHYANIDFPAGAYDEERIQYIKGALRLRVRLPRPRTRFDRILSFPVVRQIDTAAMASAAVTYASDAASYSAKVAFTAGIYSAFEGPPTPPNPEQFEVVAREAIADAFMRLDANFQTVPPAQCMRITDFKPRTIAVGVLGNLIPNIQSELDFFAENADDKAQWTLYSQILGYPDVATMLNAHFRGNLIAEWDTIFNTDIAPIVFERLLDSIRLDQFATDLSTASKYHGGEHVMLVNVMGTTSKARNQLPALLDLTVAGSTFQALKKYVTATIESLSINYATSHYQGALFHGSIGDDLLDGTRLPIPENADEKRYPRREDRFVAAKLIEHLNTNLEYYNKVLWYRLDADRRYMLLDGFSIQVYGQDGNPLPAPGGLRSLASVVKNDVIAVAGNSLVMPVAPGYRVDGSFVTEVDGTGPTPTLLDHYKPITPEPPYRISVPSKGVFVEAVQGACNACERIETDRLQDWNRYPIGDAPPAINAVNVPTPGVTDWKAGFKDFAAPIVNVQNAPTVPAPGAGLAGLAELLGKSGVFKDITGLDANQQNAMRTYISNQENAKAFAQMAKEMAMQQHNTQNTGKIMDSIATAKQSGDISKEDAGKLVKDHLQQQIDGGTDNKAKSEQAPATPLTQAAVDAARQGKNVKAEKTDSEGNTEAVTITGQGDGPVLADVVGSVPGLAQQLQNDCWAVSAAIMTGWKENRSLSPDEVVARAGQKYLRMYKDDTGLASTDKDDFIIRLRMAAEPLQSNVPQRYVDLLRAFGPLWITTDSASRAGVFSPHARILRRITGSGSADGVGTQFVFVDPKTGTEASESFATFVNAFEQTVRDNKAQGLFLQVVHFIDGISERAEGYQIEGPFDLKEPIHEQITLAALSQSALAVPAKTRPGDDQAINEFLRGVLWNDDPAVLLFDEDLKDNWNFSSGISWYFAFKMGGRATQNNLTNLTGRSHYWDMQFLHAMAAAQGEQPLDTLAKILLWCEVMYRLATGDGLGATDSLQGTTIVSSQSDGASTYSYSLASYFDASSFPAGTDTLATLLTQGTACKSLDLRRRALGSLLHLVQDSYARGHVRRTLLNPEDQAAPDTLKFKPGKYGRFGEVENFHVYRGQDSKEHDKFDERGGAQPSSRDLDTFNGILGARDAIAAAKALVDMWVHGTDWGASGGPRDFLTDTVFKLAATASPASPDI